MSKPVEHTMVAENQPFKGSGKDKSIMGAPIVSMSPTSKQPVGTPEASKPKIIDKVSDELINLNSFKEEDEDYPFSQLEVGQAFFVSAKNEVTTDALVEKMNARVYYTKQKYGEIEKNENGDEIWEQVTVKTRKRNDDGTIQLEPDGKPTVGAHFTHVAKMAYARNFIVRPVAKDMEISKGQNATEDGVMIIRVA